MTSEIERASAGRSSGAVLKIAVSYVRARDKKVPILVFEGTSDVGPYEAWISQIRNGWRYQPLPGTGKGQVLDLRRRLQNDTTGLQAGVVFFVDRDFDDLRGHADGPDIFCTDTYSIENYLVSEDVLRSILLDEFKCAHRHAERDLILPLFHSVREQFNACMSEANKRIFRARKLKIEITSIARSLSKYMSVSVSSVTINANANLKELVVLKREFSEPECNSVDGEFTTLSPNTRHRGKFVLEFFLKWLDELSNECRNGECNILPSRFENGFNASTLTLRSLASRSSMPTGLQEFIWTVDPPMRADLP